MKYRVVVGTCMDTFARSSHYFVSFSKRFTKYGGPVIPVCVPVDFSADSMNDCALLPSELWSQHHR